MPTPEELHYRFCFEYRQFQHQTIGGWCGALSEAILVRVRGRAATLPGDAARHAQEVCEAPDSSALLRRQRQGFEGPFALAGRDWVYTFDGEGTAFMRLCVRDVAVGGAHAPGSDWAEWSEGTVNHSGVVIWRGNEVFAFDPNAGGATFRPRLPAKGRSFAEDVDVVLGQLYVDHDRHRGRRSSYLVSTPQNYSQSWLAWLAGD